MKKFLQDRHFLTQSSLFSLLGNEILYRDEIGNLLIYNVELASSKIILNMTNSVSISKSKYDI